MKKAVVLASALSLFSIQVQARPQVESTRGNVRIQEQGKEMVVHASDNAIINYRSFDVQADEAVWFQMQDASHRVLNRVNSAHPSHVDGRLISNGIVYLLNPAGVIFGPHSIVDVNTLMVAAAHLSDDDFINRRDYFGSIGGNVEVFGHLSAKEVRLIGLNVIQKGKVDAKTTIYSVGDHYYLGKEGEHLFVKCEKEKVTGDQNPPFLGCGAAEGYLIHHSGITKADSVHIYGAEGSKIHLSGTMDVSHRDDLRAGGTVIVQGETIEMRKAHIDVTGLLGGGTVFIGGGENGQGLYPTAMEVDCDSLSTIAADSLVNGDGGKIVLFGSRCKANGLYSVMGGIQGGNAGVIETSGSRFQSLTTRTRMFAPSGKSGVWKIDPYSIQIVDMGGSDLSNFDDQTSNNSYVINSSVINNAPAGSKIIFAANNSAGYTPGTCSIAIGTPSTPANINSSNPDVTLVFDTTESPTVRGMMTINGSISSDTIVFKTPVTLTGPTNITASSSLNFNHDVGSDGKGPWDLKINAQKELIAQGSITQLGSFSFKTPENRGTFHFTTPTTLQAIGDISIGAALKLSAPASFISEGGGITFHQTVTSPANLTISAQKDLVFNAPVGPMGDLVIQKAHDLHFKETVSARSFTQHSGSGNSRFEKSLTTRSPSQEGGDVFIKTDGKIQFGEKAFLHTTGARAVVPGDGFSGGSVTLIGDTVHLSGIYAGGTPAFPGTSCHGGQGGDVRIETVSGLHLNGPIFATGGAGVNGGGQVLPTLIFSGQNLEISGSDSPGNITLSGPIFLKNFVTLRGQQIKAPEFTGDLTSGLAIDGATSGQTELGNLSQLGHFVVNYSKGVELLGDVEARSVTLFNSGSEGISFKGTVTAGHLGAIANQFGITFAKPYVAQSVSLLNCSDCSCRSQSSSAPFTSAPAHHPLEFAGVYAPSPIYLGDISFDTPTSLFSLLHLVTSPPFAAVFSPPLFSLNYLTPPRLIDYLTQDQLVGK